MPKLMIGFAGEMGSGKGVATEFVKQWYPETPSFRFSDALREFYIDLMEHSCANKKMQVSKMITRAFGKTTLFHGTEKNSVINFTTWLTTQFIPKHDKGWTTQASTTDLQEISTAVRKYFGADILERAIIARVDSSKVTSPIVVIEGVRRMSDIATLMQSSAVPFGLLYVQVDALTRYARHKARAEKPGDAELSLDDFYELGRVEAEREIVRLRPRAHAIIDNSGELSHLEIALRGTIEAWLTHGPHK